MKRWKVTRKAMKTSAIIAAPMALAISGTAHADDVKPLSVEVGVVHAADGTTRSATSDAGFHFGLGYELKTKALLAPARSTPSIQFHFNRVDGRGNTVNAASFLYVEKLALSKDERKPGHSPGVWYFGLGVGLTYLDGTGPAPSSGGSNSGGGGSNASNEQLIVKSRSGRAGSGSTFSENKLMGAARFSLGADLTDRLFVEGAYNATGSVAGLRASTFSVSVGFRF